MIFEELRRAKEICTFITQYLMTETATETIFKYLFFSLGARFSRFFQEASCVHRTDTNFKVYLLAKQIPIFQKHLFGYRTDTEFSRSILCAHQTDTNFPGRYVCSPNRYQFSRSNFYMLTEQLSIFQEYLLGYWTNFPGRLFWKSSNR